MIKIPLFKKKPSTPRRRTSQDDSQTKRNLSTFQMNRTLIGSTSAKFASTNERDAEFQSPRARAHHLISLRRRLGLFFLVVAAGGIVSLVLVNSLIATVHVSGPETINQSGAYQSRIETYLDNRPFSRLLFWLNNNQLAAYLQEKYPEVKSVTIQRQGSFGNADAAITLRTPIARWHINGRNSYVDGSGVVFSYTTQAIPKLQIIDNSGVPTSGSASIASISFLEFVGKFVGDMKQYGYTVRTATIPADSIREIDIQVDTVSYRFKTTTDRSAGDQAQDISRIIPYLNKQHMYPSYVDVRLNGEAFYK